MITEQTLKQIYTLIAEDVKAYMLLQAEQEGVNDKVGINTLVPDSNLYKTITVTGDGAQISLFVNYYIYYIQSGRKAKHVPRVPIAQLERWIKQKHLNLNPWAVQEQIWRDGIKPRPVIDTFNRHLNNLPDKIADLFIEKYNEELNLLLK